jgi:hypothetical protein
MIGTEEDKTKAQTYIANLKTNDARPILRAHRILPVAVDISLLNGFAEMVIDALKLAAEKLPAAAVIKACGNGTPSDQVKNLLAIVAPGKEKAWIVEKCDAE